MLANVVHASSITNDEFIEETGPQAPKIVNALSNLALRVHALWYTHDECIIIIIMRV